jgi:hypothetical protein
MSLRRSFVLICSGVLAPAVIPGHDAPDAGGQGAALRDVALSLARHGHEVEVWTVQSGDERPTQLGVDGLFVRRFRGRDAHLVPSSRPCWWVAEWVTCATAHLMTAPEDAAIDATLVTFGAEAGVAGRLLALRFGFDLIHVPDSAPPSAEFSSRLAHEDEETCRVASAVVPAGPELPDWIPHAAPPRWVDRSASVPLASLGDDSQDESNDSAERGPWHWYTAAANKYAFVGIESII